MARVLVVDDEENQVRVLAIGLRLEGFEVETARSGDAALTALEGTPFELAIVDLMMPSSNGLELSRRIREEHPQTRVVLTSAYHLSERQLARADCGVVGFVPKPYEMTELASFLRAKLTSSSRTLAAAPASSSASLSSRFDTLGSRDEADEADEPQETGVIGAVTSRRRTEDDPSEPRSR